MTRTGESASDVDIMIHPRDLASVPAMLTQSARSAGAGLVQAIRHETTGCYFILAKQDGRDVGFLDPDCCSDYRRGGRLWLSADQVIARSRRSLDIYVPSIPDEFTYYLLKKILKQSITAHQLKRLHDLFASDTAECQRRLARFWPETTALRLQRAFVEEDLSWFQTRLEDLLLELKRSAPMERWCGRCAARLHDLMRLLQRIVYPDRYVGTGDGRQEQPALDNRRWAGGKLVAGISLDIQDNAREWGPLGSISRRKSLLRASAIDVDRQYIRSRTSRDQLVSDHTAALVDVDTLAVSS